MSASPVSIVSNSPATVELKFPVTKKVQFSVLDTSHFLPHPNIEALFRKRSVNGNCFARERTGEDGLGEVTLELGTWEVEVRNSTLPDGYYFSGPIETQQIVVIKEDDSKPVPPILIALKSTLAIATLLLLLAWVSAPEMSDLELPEFNMKGSPFSTTDSTIVLRRYKSPLLRYIDHLYEQIGTVFTEIQRRINPDGGDISNFVNVLGYLDTVTGRIDTLPGWGT